MKVYQTDRIRNIGIVAHGGAGKTTLTEAILFTSGAIKRLGKVEEGNTTTDYHPEEIKRKVTINLATAPCEWKDHKINLIDTPGYSDFIGDVKSTIRVVDALLVCLCAVAGVEVQTEAVWEFGRQEGLPRLAFINKMDRENANFDQVISAMREIFTDATVIPIQIPLGQAETFRGIIDLIDQKALVYKDGGIFEVGAIPPDLVGKAEEYRLQLVEAAAEADDELLVKYLDGEELTAEEIRRGLRRAILNAKVVPTLCGSALKNIGMAPLLDAIVEYSPSPAERAEEPASELDAKPLSALVFKTIADPYVGRVSLFRVFTGTIKSDSTVYNSNKETEEKVSQLFAMVGKNQQPLPEIYAGDIGAATKLQVTTTGDTLATKQDPIILRGIDFPTPTLGVTVRPKTKGDEDKLSNALTRLMEEDATLRLEKNPDTKETILYGLGELHLDIVLERLQRKFGVEVETGIPKIPYRETIRTSSTRVEGKYKKQTGGHGQYGHVFLNLEPLPDAEFEFQETIFGGAVPKQYIPAVEKGVREAMQEGILAGYPVTNVKVTLVDGSYHPVDSSEMAFKIASSLAFKKAMEASKPVLLEPIMNVEVTVPEPFMGDIIGDLNSKRGRILGMEPQERYQVIKAQVPLAEMSRYAIDLKSITQGRGSFKMEFSHYEEVPVPIAEKIIEQAKAARAAEGK